MEDANAIRIADLTADLMMVIGRMKGSVPNRDRGTVHPGTEYAVLDTILRYGCRTVPEIAARRGVTRQSVQAVVNKLIDAGLLSQRDNPEHKSSKLITVEDAGQERYERARGLMRERYRGRETELRKGDLEAAERVMALISSTWGLDGGNETE